ncbi:5-bromo-4-chloroindolyl phosphate hydrolase, partial [Staphylococcus chromogenes]
MRYQFSRLFGGLVGIPVAVIAFFTSILTFDISFIYDMLIGSAGFVLGYIPT